MLNIVRDDSKWILQFFICITLISGVWNGFACLSNPCVNGVCLDDLNSTYFCYCINGYTGIECQTNWNECWSSPCQNGGVCIDGIATFTCSCTPGYSGALCQQDIDECESNPCLNNGTCTDVLNGYTCHCVPGYSGVHCEIDIAVCNTSNETRCSNGGICVEGVGDTFTCQCQSGWSGLLCEEEIDECLSSPCQNGAICIDAHDGYSCACLFGYTGTRCEEVIQICDDNPCKNGALCLVEDDHFVCYCVPDFHGDRCQFQYDECQLGPRCLNGGTCIDGIDNSKCSCPPKLTGVLCECLILVNNTLDCTYTSPETTELVTLYTDQSLATGFPSTFSSSQWEVTEESTTSYNILSTQESMISSLATMFYSTPATYGESTTVDNYSITEHLTDSYPIITLPDSTEFRVTTQPSSTAEIFDLATESGRTIESSSQILMTSPEEYSVEETETVIHTSTYSYDATTTESPTTEETTSIVPIYSTEFITSESIISTSSGENDVSRAFPDEETTFISSISPFFTKEPDMLSSYASEFESTVFTTAKTIHDCSRPQSPCKNGGTCLFTNNTHTCLCPLETEGKFCEVSRARSNIAFEGKSYVSYKLFNYSKVVVEFDVKTMTDRGLLFYWFMDTIYMELYMEDGNLKFKFSCGYQTMLLSELKSLVNDGYIFTMKAWIDFKDDFSHCYAGIKVNDTLEMTGDLVARMKVYYKPSTKLYIGGLPDYVSPNIVPVTGFVGCMSNLKISNRARKIYEDADEMHNVRECTSLPCLSNPCSNGGTCYSKGNIWHCSCRNGYTGRTCTDSICDHNPCLFGATCLPFTHDGYICLCPYGKHGHFCENDLKISEPFFSSTINGLSSYVAYPFPDGITKNMELMFRFSPTTMNQISLLLFLGQIGQHDYYSDHLAVSFVKGYIMLTWNLGSGPRRIFTNQPIREGAKEYLVKIGHVGRRAWLYVENLGNITGRSPGNLVKLDVASILYVGGHESKNFSTLPHDLPLHTGFSGCIFDIEMKSGSVTISFQGNQKTVGRAVGQCGTNECYDQSCQNGGACLHHGSTFMCICQENWYGPLCMSKSNYCDANITMCAEGSACVPEMNKYECDCPFGQVGKYCELKENITDVSLTGTRSFIAMKPVELDVTQFHIEVEIRTLRDNGVILITKKNDSYFICLSLTHGVLELRVQTGRKSMYGFKLLTVRSSKLLIKAVWHTVKLGIYGKRVYLSVNNIINTGILDILHNIPSREETIFLGGLPDLSDFPVAASSSLPVYFTGCIRQIIINEKSIPLTSHNIVEARNMVDCDGTPCGKELCRNSGTCWIDSFMKPHCACVSPYYGETCQLIEDCDERKCGSNGECHGRRCLCKVGWSGVLCQKQINVTVPKFSGESYLIVRKVGDKRRALQARPMKSLSLNFTTVHSNGLLLWHSDKAQNFFGVGLEHGFLKLANSFKNKTFIEVYSDVLLADGLWHTIELMLEPFVVIIDNKLMENGNRTIQIDVIRNDTFYIGGFPQGSHLVQETHGLFEDYFKGCLESFGDSNDFTKHFNRSEGRNINICDLF